VTGTYHVARVPARTAKDFVKEHHYTHGCHNGPIAYGLFRDDALVGVIAFACPSSENVRASVFGPEFKAHVIELHRLVVLDVARIEGYRTSKFVSLACRQFGIDRPDYWAVLSYADASEGHTGKIYQACGFRYTGFSDKQSIFYRDADGRLHHPRQAGVNITRAAALARGWSPEKRQGKYRYLKFLGGSVRKGLSTKKCLLPELAYPGAR
jgi:hypothetical protein